MGHPVYMLLCSLSSIHKKNHTNVVIHVHVFFSRGGGGQPYKGGGGGGGVKK
jgi:hypothetical protein